MSTDSRPELSGYYSQPDDELNDGKNHTQHGSTYSHIGAVSIVALGMCVLVVFVNYIFMNCSYDMV